MILYTETEVREIVSPLEAEIERLRTQVNGLIADRLEQAQAQSTALFKAILSGAFDSVENRDTP